jgi:hypothetical protein
VTFNPEEMLDFDFVGVEPATSGFTTLPAGEYNVQCVAAKKYYTGEAKALAEGRPIDTSKPNLEFSLIVINHPDFNNEELRLSHSLGEKSRPFLLNTLMCLIPEVNWQQGGLKYKLGDLIRMLVGKTANATVDNEIAKSMSTGNDYVRHTVKALKKYDPTVPPPKVTENNPPRIQKGNASPTQQAAAGGVVSPEETANFLNQWPGGTTPAPAPTEGTAIDFGF